MVRWWGGGRVIVDVDGAAADGAGEDRGGGVVDLGGGAAIDGLNVLPQEGADAGLLAEAVGELADLTCKGGVGLHGGGQSRHQLLELVGGEGSLSLDGGFGCFGGGHSAQAAPDLLAQVAEAREGGRCELFGGFTGAGLYKFAEGEGCDRAGCEGERVGHGVVVTGGKWELVVGGLGFEVG